MNILVTGSNGQLGQEIKSIVEKNGNGVPNHKVGEPNYYIFVDINELDITDFSAVEKFVKENYINVIINCAAYTNVEKAQTDRHVAFAVNAVGPKNLANAADSVGAVLIQISTDYVFGGQRNTPVPPVVVGSQDSFPNMDMNDCYYGYSKNAGEDLIKKSNCRYLIFRTAWLYSEYGHNFVKTMAQRAAEDKPSNVVLDQTGSPTYAKDLAEFIYHIIEDCNVENRYLYKTGVYNFTNKGATSWYDFAFTIYNLYNGTGEEKVSPCMSNEIHSNVNRPNYSVLDTSLTEKTFDYKIRNWQTALKEVITKIK